MSIVINIQNKTIFEPIILTGFYTSYIWFTFFLFMLVFIMYACKYKMGPLLQIIDQSVQSSPVSCYLCMYLLISKMLSILHDFMIHQRCWMVLRLTKSDSPHNFFLSNKKFAYRSFRPTTICRVTVGQVRIYKWIIQHHESLTREYFKYSIKIRINS